MIRRGFTMLELTLATLVGVLVLASALGVFASMDRGDRVLSARAKENSGLEQAATAIEKALGMLVMDTGGQSKTKTGGDPKADAGMTANGTADGTAGGTGGKSDAAAPVRGRFMLETDATPGLPLMPDIGNPETGGGGAAVALGTSSPPQRLELVLSRHPAPLGARPAASGDITTVADAGAKPGVQVQGDSKPVAVRGAFDLRPEPAAPGAASGGRSSGTTWSLWWRPIERRVDDSGAEVYAGVDELAVRLATGLTSCRWRVFYQETWKAEHSTAAVLDLPAYVELRMSTSAGLDVDWLFEVAWSMGPEFKPAEQAGDAGDDEGTPGASKMTVPGMSGASAQPPATAPGVGATGSSQPNQPSTVRPAKKPVFQPPTPRKPAGAPSSAPKGKPAGAPK